MLDLWSLRTPEMRHCAFEVVSDVTGLRGPAVHQKYGSAHLQVRLETASSVGLASRCPRALCSSPWRLRFEVPQAGAPLFERAEATAPSKAKEAFNIPFVSLSCQFREQMARCYGGGIRDGVHGGLMGTRQG